MKKSISLTALLLFSLLVKAQTVSITDFGNFLQMRDSVMNCPDSSRQLALVHTLYMDKASDGLKAFMRNKDGLDHKWLSLIRTQPLFWDSLQKRSGMVAKAAKRLNKQIDRFSRLYPGLKPAKTYFLVGIRQQGGTIRGNLSLIGTEVVLSGDNIDEKQLVRMGLHEYVHTQQARPDFQHINVLTSSIREGACDFVSWLLTGILPSAPYMAYGKAHEQEVWLAFSKDMYTGNNDNWVSTGNNPALPAPDLGYFVGFQICKAFYSKAPDKKLALKQIIELNYADAAAVNEFLARSGYAGKE
jgi:hypothetical protein